MPRPTRSLSLVCCLMLAAQAVAAPRPPPLLDSIGGLGPEMLHADLVLTGPALGVSPTVEMLTATPPALAAPLPPSSAPAVASAAPDGTSAKESVIRRRARARRAKAAAEAASEKSAPAKHRVHHESAPAGEEQIASEAAAGPQPAAYHAPRLFEGRERSSFETPEPQAPAPRVVAKDDDHPHYDRVSIRGEALYLKRDKSPNTPLANSVNAAGVADGRTTLALDQVQKFDGASGFRTEVLYRVNPHDAVGVSYFGSQTWQMSASIPAAAGSGIQSPFLGTTIPTADESFNGSVSATYQSQVHNGELNWYREFDDVPTPDARYILGLRWFTFRDDLELIGGATAANLAERTREIATNDLVAFQGGIDYRHPIADRFDFGFVGKACLGVNIAHTHLTNTTGPTPNGLGTTLFAANGADSAVAGMVDGTVQLMYAPADAFMIRGGYQLVYAQSLVLAPENLSRTGTSLRDFPQTPLPAALGSSVSHAGSVLLNGAFVGAEVRF